MTDDIKAIREALKELMSIVEIHSDNTDNNFAWAEMIQAKDALAVLDRIDAQKPRVPMAFLLQLIADSIDTQGIEYGGIKQIAARYGVEITEVIE